jgi:hypothetical protein
MPGGMSLVNTDDLDWALLKTERRVLESKPNCTDGLATMPVDSSTTCSIWWPIPCFYWRCGIGCGGTWVLGPLEWTGAPPR